MHSQKDSMKAGSDSNLSIDSVSNKSDGIDDDLNFDKKMNEDDKIYEDNFALAFKDINAQAKVHVLVIPKGAYVDMNDFAANAKSDEIEGLIRALGKVASILGVSASGYRYLGNNGRDGGQEVPHLHFHIFGGEKLGRMIHK